MSSGKKARGGRSQAATLSSGGGDSIGALPDALLHHILSFLPAQQAVQTCVLARRWLHLWKSATGVRIVGAADGKEPAPFEEVRVFVDNLLLLRGCSPLETLELRFSGDSHMDLPRLRLWIRHAVLLCKLQVLQLKISGARPTWFQPDNPPLVSEHLTRLEFHGIMFNDDAFFDFSRCPSLLDLHIEMCGMTSAKRISSKSLKHLTITKGSFSAISRTCIYAPNLLSLEVHVDRGRNPLLERMPSLVWAVVKVSSFWDTCYYRPDQGDCGEESCDACMQDDSSTVLLQGLSQAKRLSLTAATRTFIRRDLKNCPTFSRLKSLVLNEHWCVPDMHALKCILEHSPILEELCLLLFSEGPKHKVEMKGWFNAKDLSCAIYAHLKRVEVKCEVVDDRVLKVLRFLSKLNLCFSFKEMEV